MPFGKLLSRTILILTVLVLVLVGSMIVESLFIQWELIDTSMDAGEY